MVRRKPPVNETVNVAVPREVHGELKDLMHERKLDSLGEAVRVAVREVRASA